MTEKFGLALGYRWEKFRVKDFATINLASWNELPRIDLGGLTTGYGTWPYRGRDGTFRVFRLF